MEKEAKTENIKLFLSKNDKLYTKMLEESKSKKMNLAKIQESMEKIKYLKEERPSLTNQINIADYLAKKQKLPKEKLYLNYEEILLLGDTPSTLQEFIENELAKKSEEYNILRIVCLESLIHGGIKNKIFEQFKKDFINIYGFQEIFLLHNLEKMNVLRNYESSNNYYGELNKKLKLINESVNLENPNDNSYAYNGYCPLSIRLIEKAFSKGWNSIKDLLN